jgi:hypothetical protein
LTFLNSAILFALSAAILPFLIHLFTRTKHKTVPFSTLEFLKELQNNQIRKLKLRQLLLLLLRFLIIVLLVLAFARPTLKGNLSGVVAPNAKSTVAIVLDNSPSMDVLNNGTTSYELAKERLDELIDAMQSGDEIYYLTPGDTSSVENIEPFFDSGFLKKKIENTTVLYGTSELSSVLTTADQLLVNSNNVNKELFVFSDAQQTAFGQDSLLLQGIHNYALTIQPKEIQNLSIIDVEIGASILEQGKVIEIVPFIQNYGGASINNKLVQLFVNGKRVAQKSVNVPAKSAVSESFKFVLESTGFVGGYFVLEDDDLLGDNRRYFSFYVPGKLRVALVGSSTDIRFVELALSPTSIQNRYELEKLDPDKLNHTSFESYDVIVLSNIQRVDEATADRMQQFVNNGGGLFIIAGQNLDLKSFNTNLAAKLQLPVFTETLGALSQSTTPFSFGNIDDSHPIFQGVFKGSEFNFSKPLINFALKIKPQSNIQEIIKYSNGDAFLYEKMHTSGKILVMTTGLNRQISDLPMLTIFAPLMTRCTSYLASQKQTKNENIIGTEIKYHLEPQHLSSNLIIERPDGSADNVSPRLLPTGSWVFYNNTDVPGIYSLKANGAVLGLWSVNLPSKESDLNVVPEKELREKYSLESIDMNSDFQALIQQNRFGQELWKYFAIMAFILLIVEMLIYREKGRPKK